MWTVHHGRAATVEAILDEIFNWPVDSPDQDRPHEAVENLPDRNRVIL